MPCFLEPPIMRFRYSKAYIFLLIVYLGVTEGFVAAPSERGLSSKTFFYSSALRVSSSSLSNNSAFESTTIRNASTTVATIPSRHIRWYSDSENTWALQTAVTTWKRPTNDQKVELHAMVHFGDESYYQAYNDPEFSKDRTVIYELLLDDSMLTTEGNHRRVANPLGASLVDRNTAARYGWSCQVDVLDYQRPQWRHADWTRGEFLQALYEKQQKHADLGLPAWRQVHASPSAAAEAATAWLVGPPTMSDRDSRRRLFSNLFLPGSNFAQVLRLTLWMTVPAPELSILLLDWSSTTSSRNVWQASWSPVLRFVLQAITSARLDIIQRLAFGQVLITGSRPSGAQQNNVGQYLLIQGRNQQALTVLDQTLQENDKNDVAILYGSSHCPDLSQSLRQRGFVPQSTAWRTAWSVQLDGYHNNEAISSVPFWMLPAALYLVASGTDWLASWQAVGNASDDPGQMALLAAAYGVRHVLLYLGISKVVLDWQRPGGVE